jgi:hypothetical protein
MPLHIAPPSSRLKKQSPRREEDQPEGDCAIYAKRRVTRLRIAHKPAVLTRGGLTAPRAVRPGLASTMKNQRSEEKKTHLQARSLHASLDKTCKWIPSQEVPKAAFARKKGHLGKDCSNGNTPQSNLVHYEFHNLRNDKIDACTMSMNNSPQVSASRASFRCTCWCVLARKAVC